MMAHSPVLKSNHEFNGAPVISSEARNPGQKTKISQSQPLTSFETRSFEMTTVDLCWPSGGLRKRPQAGLCGPHSDTNFENPYKWFFFMAKSDNEEAI